MAVARSTRSTPSSKRSYGPRAAAPDAAWSDLVAKMSHDIRTPLNAVIGFADLMQRELHGSLGSERYREYASHIRDCGVDLLRAAEETLLLTVLLGSPDTIAKEPVSLRTLIEDVSRQLINSANAPLPDLQVEMRETLGVMAEQLSLGLAIRHLLSAALSLIPHHDGLIVRAESEHGVVRLDMLLAAAAGDRLRNGSPGVPAGQLLLARSILRLQGAQLVEGALADGIIFSVLIEEAAQADFFGH